MAAYTRRMPTKALSPSRAAAILKRRWATDPCRQYTPGPTQDEFHRSDAYFRLVTGGGRSGKTTSCLIDLVWCLRGIHPHKKWDGPVTALVFCVSRQQAAMVAQKKMFERCEFPDIEGKPPGIGQLPLIPKREIKEIGSIKAGFRAIYECKLHNGSIVYFSWSDADETWKRIQGVKIDYIYIDENAGNEKLLIECRKRLVDSQRPGTWRGCLTWGGTGTENNKAFDDFRGLCLDPRELDHAYFQIKPGENKAVTKEALDRFAATLTEEERKIHITGEVTASSLVQIYQKQWSDERHMLRSDYVVSDDDNLWLSYDPGVDHPTGMLISAIRRDQPISLTFVKFWNHARQTLDYDVACLEKWLRGRRLAGVVYDAQAGATEKRDGRSILDDMQEKFAAKGLAPLCGYYKSQKRHAPGIAMVRHFLDPDPYDKTVTPLIHVNPSEESGCRLLRYQLMKYQGKESTKFTGEGGVVKKEDEGCDCARYQVMKRAAYNPDWRCGPFTKAVPFEDRPPIDLPRPPEPELTPYERHLKMSRERTRRGVAQSWRVVDVFD